MTEIDGENYVIGYTSRYVRVAVPIGADGTFEKGAVVFVKLEKQGPHDVLLGHFAEWAHKKNLYFSFDYITIDDR